MLADPTGGTVAVIEEPIEPVPVSKEEADSFRVRGRRSLEEAPEGIPPEAAERMRASRRGYYDKVPIAEFHPVWSGLVIDADERVWVVLPPDPDEPGLHALVYDRDGERVGAVRFAGGVGLGDAKGDLVLTTTYDDLGVPTVQLRRIAW